MIQKEKVTILGRYKTQNVEETKTKNKKLMFQCAQLPQS